MRRKFVDYAPIKNETISKIFIFTKTDFTLLNIQLCEYHVMLRQILGTLIYRNKIVFIITGK